MVWVLQLRLNLLEKTNVCLVIVGVRFIGLLSARNQPLRVPRLPTVPRAAIGSWCFTLSWRWQLRDIAAKSAKHRAVEIKER